MFHVYNININIFTDYTPFKVITKYWLYFPLLYNISLLLIDFIDSNLCLSIPYPHFPLPTGNH